MDHYFGTGEVEPNRSRRYTPDTDGDCDSFLEASIDVGDIDFSKNWYDKGCRTDQGVTLVLALVDGARELRDPR